MNIIECKNLTHYYGKRMIYDNLSFNVPQGRILGLLGKNGTGKTTTINILSGYLEPQKGECLIFGENIRKFPHQLRQKIGLLIEGHVQYQFMNIEQIERFYAPFYPNWNKDAYYELMNRLKVAPKQMISRMSCGQRSQVALGLILAQNPELLVLDDFSLGLDPGYRRLFVEYLRDYAKSENKTVFLTSHIIQDMERLIDDCIFMDYGGILMQDSIKNIAENVKKFTIEVPDAYTEKIISPEFYYPAQKGNMIEFTASVPTPMVEAKLQELQVPFSSIKEETLNLEDAFIGLTGKY